VSQTNFYKLSRVLRLPLCFALLILCASLGFAQEQYGSLRGTVKDANGAAVPGATVTATSTTAVRPVETTADNDGNYFFRNLLPGVYSITASQQGFSTVKADNVTVQLGQELSLELVLPVGDIAATVNITDTSEAIDVTSSRTVTNISEQMISTTPKGRTFESILKVAPGVRNEPKAGNEGVGGISIDGASGAENAFILDGVEVTDVRKGQLRRADAIPYEFIREVQVKSGGFEAEFGGATGGVVNVVTRSGGNEFHGEVAYSQTGSAFNSRVRGYYQRNPGNANLLDFFRSVEDEYRSAYPGFSVGGPIIKDRINFFTSYFPEFIRTERTRTYTFNNQPFTSVQNISRHYGLARLDIAPAKNLQINTSYIWTPTKVTGLLASVDPRVQPNSDQLSGAAKQQGGYTPSSSYSAALTWTPTSKLIVSSRFGYKYLNDKGSNLNANFTASGGSYGLSGSPYIVYQRGTAGQTNPPVPAQFAGSSGFTNVASTFLTIKDITTRHNFYLDLSYIANIGGQQHIFKTGYALNRLSNDVKDDYTNGRFDIYWGDVFNRGSIVDAHGTYGYYIWEDGVRHEAAVNSRNQGVYVQDSWQIHPRVTLNLGLRFENEFLPPYKAEVNGVKVANPVSFGWTDKIAPRLGLAWDVKGNGKWKISASYGSYFDVMKYELARGSFGGDTWFSHVYKLDNLNFGAISRANPGALGAPITTFDNRTIPINAAGELEGIDPQIRPYEQREFSVRSEHQISRNDVFSVRYTRKRLMRAIEDIGVLDADGNEVYVIGNPGFGQRSDLVNTYAGVDIKLKPGQSLVPQAKREYDALETRWDGRFVNGFAKNLSYFLSYTYSRLYGNYAGLANSDENGRSDPSVTRLFDLPYGNFDQNGNNVYGRLATDRPHAFTAFVNYPLKWKGGTTTFSVSQVAFSGTPVTTEATVIVPIFPFGRGDLGRTDTFTQTDLLLQHQFNFTERYALRLEANVQNLFNQAAVLNIRPRLNRNGNIQVINGHNVFDGTDPLGPQTFFTGGFNVKSLLNSGVACTTRCVDPAYGLPGTLASGLTPEGSNAYQGIREIRLGVRFIF
jgi:hypothetical protein